MGNHSFAMNHSYVDSWYLKYEGVFIVYTVYDPNDALKKTVVLWLKLCTIYSL